MILSGRISRQIQLSSLVLLVVPLILFPERLGTSLAKASLIFAVYELAFYSFVMFLFNSRASLIQIVQAAAVCLVYRLVLGAGLGLLLVIPFSMKLSVSLALGMSGYIPAIGLHILAVPFVLRPALTGIFDSSGKTPLQQPKSQTSVEPISNQASIAVSRERGYSAQPTTDIMPNNPSRLTGGVTDDRTGVAEVNGFEKAVSYIGEDGSVHLAAVVDKEGLLLAHFERRGLVAEDYAPLAILALQQNAALSGRLGEQSLERIDLSSGERRTVVVDVEHAALLVLSEIKVDDVLNIRINQGVEMIRKQMAERYAKVTMPNAERKYVSSIE